METYFFSETGAQGETIYFNRTEETEDFATSSGEERCVTTLRTAV